MFGKYIKESYHFKKENASSLQFNIRQRVGLWIRRPWFDSQRSQFTACGHSDGKGATDVCERPGASVGVGLAC